MINSIIENVEKNYLKQENAPQFDIGDTVDVHTRIVEGDKERIQVFGGTVIMRRGRGINETFTVRRIVNNEGVERIFPVHSPFISKLVVKRGGESRRAKLFYLRDRVGKAVRLSEKRTKGGKRDEAAGGAETAPSEPAGASSKVEAGELAASAT
jgi:large subunit ribosomal protein L19